MKTEDFDRLKSVCEKEGFILELSSPWDQTYRISKKDIWEGVGFVQSNSGHKIYPIIQIGNYKQDPEEFKPSTEEAYVEQLKAEAFKRFGEIKDGDRFDCSKLGSGTSPIIFNQLPNPDWYYLKNEDDLRLGGFSLYQQGKWATKLPERVKVKFNFHGIYQENQKCESHEFNFTISNQLDKMDLEKAGKFLASQLEKYLNG